MGVNRRARALLLVTTLLLGVLPASPLLGLVTGSDESCNIHGRSCTCVTMCRRNSKSHSHDAEPKVEGSPGLQQKPSCHGEAAGEPTAKAASVDAPSTGCFMRSCGDSPQPLSFNGHQPFVPAHLVLHPVPPSGMEGERLEAAFRPLERYLSPPTPPPES